MSTDTPRQPSTILVTRPIELAQEFADTLHTMGYATLINPLLSIAPVSLDNADTPTQAPQPHYDTLIFTSLNAVRHLPPAFIDKHRNTHVQCVGVRTQDTAQESGFTNIAPAHVNVQALAQSFATQPQQNILYIRGVHTAYPLRDALISTGHQTDELITYDATIEPLSAQSVQAIKAGNVQAVSLFSKRTAQAYLDSALENKLLHHQKFIKFLCISDSVVKYMQRHTLSGYIGSYHVAQTPNIDGMIEMVNSLLDLETQA